MPAEQATLPPQPIATTSLGRKLFDLFVTPGDVFDEVAAAPPRLLNWLAPTCLVCLVVFFWPAIFDAGSSAAPEMGEFLPRIFAATLGPICGTLWSALVLWLTGRIFLRARFSFLKSLEVVGLTGALLILGGIVTGLLMMICGDPAARPALSLLLPSAHPADHLRAVLEVFNVFHLWSAALLAIGLSRLTGVSAREAAFWTFGYWIAVRLAIILLS